MKMQPHLPIKYGYDGKVLPKLDAPIPEGHFTPSFDDRLWLFHRRWDPPPASKKPLATLMILHGTVDHSGVYSELATKLAPEGVAVVAMDMRGWGLSDGESMYMYDMDTYVQDVVTLYEKIHKDYYSQVKARFIMGKSMGGTVAVFSCAKYPEYWTGIIGLSAAFELDPSIRVPPRIVWAILQGVGYLVPKIPFKPLFDEHGLVADPQALQAWRDDKLCTRDPFRLGYVLEFIPKLAVLKDSVAAQINMPMLLLYGQDDPIVPLSGLELVRDKNQHTDKDLKTYPKGLHNMLQEPALKDKVAADIQTWILERAHK